MYKIWTIMVREYLATVQTKLFLVSLLFMPFLLVANFVAQRQLDRMEGNQEKSFAIVDRTPGQEMYPIIEAEARRHNTTEKNDSEINDRLARTAFRVERVEPSASTENAIREQRFELSERVRRGTLSGFLEIGPDVAFPGTPSSSAMPQPDRISIRYYSSNPMQDTFAHWAERVINEAVITQRCQQAGLSRAKVEGLTRHVPVRVKGLLHRSSTTGAIEETSNEERVALFLVPVALMMLMFMVIMLGTAPSMHAVIEEKTRRIAEILLGSVRPFELMMGKLLGVTGVSLTLAVVYLGGAYLALNSYGFTEYLPLHLLAWFILFQVLAVFMYGSIFIAIGAACTDFKETQTLSFPLMMVVLYFPRFSYNTSLTSGN